MDSTVPRSIPVAVTVASEQEPVQCDGIYAERAGGFTLEFSIERDKFVIDHTAAVTSIVARGDMSYDIALGERDTETLLGTPFGEMRFAVRTTERTVIREADAISITLQYVLSSQAAGEIERTVKLTARFAHS